MVLNREVEKQITVGVEIVRLLSEVVWPAEPVTDWIVTSVAQAIQHCNN